MDDARLLRDRLRSCLESLLDLEELFRRWGHEPLVREELDMVRAYADRVDRLPLDEAQVGRLESLTAAILSSCRDRGPHPSRQRQVLQ